MGKKIKRMSKVMNEGNMKMLPYWKEIVICVLLGFFFLSVQRCNSERGQRIRLQEQADRAKIINKVDSGKQDIKNREEKLYPATDKKLRDIDTDRKELKRKEANIKTPSRKDIYEDVKKSDIDTLAVMFQRDGYPCSVMER